MKEFFELFRTQRAAIKHDGSLIQNIGYMLGNKVFILLTSFLLMPIIGRIYDKEAFGTFGLLNNIILVFTIISGLKLSEAFILPMSDERYQSLAKSSLTIIIYFCTGLFLLMAFYGTSILNYFGTNVPYWAVLTIPLLAFLLAILEYQYNHIRRLKEFKKSSTISSAANVASRLFTIGWGHWVIADFSGLLIKEILRALANIYFRTRLVLNGKTLPVSFGINKIAEVRADMREFWRFPSFEMPSNLFSMLYSSLPIYFIGHNFGVEELGDFTMVLAILNLPIIILTNSIVSVYQRSAADWIKKDTKKLHTGSLYGMGLLTFVSSVGFGLVYWFGPEIFSIFLGEKWHTAGTIGAILAPWFFARTVAPIAESLRTVSNDQGMNLLMRGLLVAATLCSFIIGITQDWSLNSIYYVMTISNCAIIFLSMILVFVRLKFNLLQAFLILGGATALGLLISYAPQLFLN